MPSNLKSIKIGYVPYSKGLTAACDRRRFPCYAKMRGISFEVFSPKNKYDLVIINTQADLSSWSRPQDDCKLILDMPDGYLSNPLTGPLDTVKAVQKFLSGKWSHLERSFTKTLLKVARRADAIVCASPEQALDSSRVNPKTHHVLDFHGTEFSVRKRNYKANKPFRLVWEGVGESLNGFASAARGLSEAAKRHPIELHILTDLRFRPINRPFYQCSDALVKRLLPGIPTYLYQWNLAFFNDIVTNCDLAVIPMLPNTEMTRVKPENRLLLFWKMGLPVLTSNTAAFERVLTSASLTTSICASQDEWLHNVLELIQSDEKREHNANLGRKHIEQHSSDEILAQSWDKILTELI